jgi:hypothetical protein
VFESKNQGYKSHLSALRLSEGIEHEVREKSLHLGIEFDPRRRVPEVPKEMF